MNEPFYKKTHFFKGKKSRGGELVLAELELATWDSDVPGIVEASGVVSDVTVAS